MPELEDERMSKRYLRWGIVFPMLLLAHSLVFAISTDEVSYEYPGYTITIYRSGKVRIDFVLNQQRIPRADIEMSFANYPVERTREHSVSEESLQRLFNLVDSPDFAKVEQEYRAPEGTFEFYGHEVVPRITLKAKGETIKEVMAGSSQYENWPLSLREVVKLLESIAVEDGSSLPRGPVIN